jgi:Protein of unknown function (DUF1353)
MRKTVAKRIRRYINNQGFQPSEYIHAERRDEADVERNTKRQTSRVSVSNGVVMKPGFLTLISVTPLSDGVNWRLEHDLVYKDSDGKILTVPAGFITDFASIPPLARIAGYILTATIPLAYFYPVFYIPVAVAVGVALISDSLNGDDLLDAPATVHDYGYRVLRGNKIQWDGVFYRAMGATNRPMWKRLLLWGNVAAFGWTAWYNNGRLIK